MTLSLHESFGHLRFLFQTGTPLWVMARGAPLILADALITFGPQRRQNTEAIARFHRLRDSLAFDTDWFSRTIPTWQRLIKQAKLDSRPDIACLEIGSWQGLSALFTLTALPKAQLTCVDTWQGADEHQDASFVSPHVLATIEQRFDENLAAFQDRITKVKSTSLAFYAGTPAAPRFDLIYIDGAHHSDAVMVDALCCFERLKPGGIMIFDDYFWRHYDTPKDNPAGAINAFLRLKRNRLDLIAFGAQIAIRKR